MDFGHVLNGLSLIWTNRLLCVGGGGQSYAYHNNNNLPFSTPRVQFQLSFCNSRTLVLPQNNEKAKEL